VAAPLVCVTGREYYPIREDTTTSLLYGHMTKMRLPAICCPKPNATQPRLSVPGPWTVTRISGLSVEEEEDIGIENATQIPELESQACVELAALTTLPTLINNIQGEHTQRQYKRKKRYQHVHLNTTRMKERRSMRSIPTLVIYYSRNAIT
jgi:hypothetical protein